MLPPDQAHEFNDCWAIGGQEAGLGLLVPAIPSSDVAISATVRAELSMLAEAWQDDILVSGDTVLADRSLAGLALVRTGGAISLTVLFPGLAARLAGGAV